MTDATAAITPSTIALGVLAEKTARNITNLANHPASGGMPASDKHEHAHRDRERRVRSVRARSTSRSPPERVRRATAMTTANAPRFIAP